MSVNYILHENAVGYSLFQVVLQADAIASRLREVQDKLNDLSLFGKMVRLTSFAPFQGAQDALENINAISEGDVTPFLNTFLEANLPQPDKKNKVVIGVADKLIAGGIKEKFPTLECQTADTSEVVADLLRGIRVHGHKLLKQMQHGDIELSQRGLAHSYSRSQVKLNPGRDSNHVKEAIAILDHLDKAVNTFSMRVKEWYSYCFPELIKIVSDYRQYAKLVLFIGDKTRLTEDHLHDLAAIVDDDASIARTIIEAGKMSMGSDLSREDMDHIMLFAQRVVSLTAYRKSLTTYLSNKMGAVAPNLSTLIGDTVAARLLSHAGALTNLAKMPASTVQILGAEKALFRALKTKGATPKYGIIYNSSFIGRAATKNKGRISRFLANKCSIASRIDNFSDTPSTRFGEALKKQVEERLEWYASGTVPTKNEIAMREAMEGMDTVLANMDVDQPGLNPKALQDPEAAKPKKRKGDETEEERRARKQAKKEKKRAEADDEDSGKKRQRDEDGDVEMSDKKKDKKKKREKHKHGKD